MRDALGGLTSPVDPALVTDTLAPADPARREICGLLRAAINGECRDAWAKVQATLPASHYLRSALPVQDAIELEPDPNNLGQRKPGWPLLAVYRTGESTSEWVFTGRHRVTQQWAVDYLLGPLDIADVRKIGDLCTCAKGAIASALLHGLYPGHPGATPAVPPYRDGDRLVVPVASLLLKKVIGPAYGKVEGLPAPWFGMTCIVETTELTQALPDPLDAVPAKQTPDNGPMDLELGLATEGAATIPDFIRVGQKWG